MASTRSTETLHSRILEDIRKKIVDGVWRPGHQMARETDLAESYGVSRMTMNKVLTQLAVEGYVIRRKRSGTFVARARAQSAVLEINNIGDEVAALGRSYRWALGRSERRHLDQADLRGFGIRREVIEDEVLYLQGVHFADDAPFCLETRAINLSVVPQACDINFAAEVPGSWLLKTMPWSTARHQVRAINAQGEEAKLLELPVGAACLEILRETKIDADWVTCARFLYPGEAHQLVAEFEARAGGEGLNPRPES
jgi:GntR family transcriptional regulator, histidine utilization repressor